MVTYCGCKISKVRWSPVSSGQKISETFVTGSADNDINTVNLWKFKFRRNESNEPKMMSEARVDGSVMDIEWTRDASRYATVSSAFLVASDAGSVGLYNTADSKVVLRHRWSRLHNGACSSVSYSKESDAFVTGGEDGALTLIQCSRANVERTMKGVASGSVNAVKFYTNNEVAFVSSFGTLTICDLRISSYESSSFILCLPNSSGLSCLDNHPAQPYLFATGGIEGSVMFWDIRNTKRSSPVKVVTAHSGAVWDIRFHPIQPNNLFTCSQDGSSWHWRETEEDSWPAYDTGSYTPQRGLSVNSVDIEGCHLVCGTDGEAIFVYPNCVSW